MIDTHAHLDFEDYNEDRDEILARFFDDNGGVIITIGVDKKSNNWAVEFAEENEKVFATISYHPEETGKIDPKEAVVNLGELAKNKKVVAIGEIGLDYFHNDKDKKQQKELFEAQLDLAIKLEKPIVIHSRDSYGDVYDILKSKINKKTKFVIHCYQASKEWTKNFLDLGATFSFTGNVTFAKEGAEIFEVIKMIPLSRMMVETDSPFLAPVSNRGKRNEPAFVREVISRIAQIKELESSEVEKQTDKNAIEFFGLAV